MQWILLFVHIPLIISFILIVAGGIDPDSRDGPTYAATEATKAGISLYIACFLILIWATAVISARLYLADSQEVKILTTVVLSLPFFVVDIVYMTCFAFESWVDKTSEMRFNVISGDVTIQLCMYVPALAPTHLDSHSCNSPVPGTTAISPSPSRVPRTSLTRPVTHL